MPKVSVIIPTYNRAEFLRSAIRSVLNQTFQDFEIIVVDDASKDKTQEVVSSFSDRRIEYIRHEINKGGSAARNTGIRMSEAEYIAFLDDDDEWLPEKLHMQVELMESSPPMVGCIYTGFSFVDRNNERVLAQRIPSKRGYLFNELANGNCIGTSSTPLLRKECFEKVGLFDERLSSNQDYDMWIQISKEYQFECIEKVLVTYRVHENKVSNNQGAIMNGLEIMLQKHDELFKSNRKVHSNYYLNFGVLSCYNGNCSKGREAFLNAIRLYPFEIRHYFNLGLSLLGTDAFKKLKREKLGQIQE